MFKNLILSGILVLAIACNPDHVTEKNEIVLDLSDAESVNSEEIFKSYRIIPLETNDSSLINRINKLYFNKGKIYVYDRKANSILIFDSTGNYLSKIKRIGKGPGEYVQFTDFAIDKKEENVVLMCDRPKKIMRFDLDGKFLNEQKIDSYYRDIAITNDYYIGNVAQLISAKTTCFIDIIDKISLKASCGLKAKKVASNTFGGYSPWLTQYNDAVYYTRVFDNKVYALRENTFDLKLTLDFGDSWLSFEEIERNTNTERDFWKYLMRSNRFCGLSNFMETKNYYVFSTFPRSKTVLITKNDKSCRYIEKFHDKNIGLNLFQHIGYCGDLTNSLTFDYPAKYFKEVILGRSDEIIDKSVISIARKISVNDNPVLIIYNFKD